MSHSFEKFEKYCIENRLRLTPPRISAFKIVQNAQKPITAYDVLELMARDINKPKPPTAYRALDFLEEHGFVHRIESLNAYIACDVNHKHNGSQFMICTECGKVEEAHMCHIPQGLQKQIDEKNFKATFWNAEIHGICIQCQ